MTLMRGECLAKRHTLHRFVNPTTHERLKSSSQKNDTIVNNTPDGVILLTVAQMLFKRN